MSRPRQEVLEEEWLIVRHSGEIPEIALHSALYYLTDDPDGPRLQLSGEERESLQEAAATRYQEIIMRDLCFENRELSIYRGVRRAICNWHRFVAFCKRQDRTDYTSTEPDKARRSLHGQILRHRSATTEALLHLVQKSRQSNGKTSTDAGRSLSIYGADDTGPSLACSFNCTFHEFTLFARELGITEEQLPPDIHLFCREQI